MSDRHRISLDCKTVGLEDGTQSSSAPEEVEHMLLSLAVSGRGMWMWTRGAGARRAENFPRVKVVPGAQSGAGGWGGASIGGSDVDRPAYLASAPRVQLRENTLRDELYLVRVQEVYQIKYFYSNLTK